MSTMRIIGHCRLPSLQLVLLMTGLLLAACRAPEPSGPASPNVVLVMADDQGWGDMAYNGHSVLQTPHFDAASEEGIRFDRFYAAAPVCSPTRGAVMTGRHPNRFGCFSWGHTLRPQEQTIAEVFRQAGYATGHFGKWHLGPARLGTPTNPGASGFETWFSAPNYFDNDPIMSRQGWAEQVNGESSMITVEAAIPFMRDQVRKEKPFFAVIWFGSPHRPHIALDEDSLLYADEPEEMRHFLGEITAMDRAFGRLREAVSRMGIEECTIIWYTGDNGGLPESGATGGRGNKGQIYEGGLRVPAILLWPERFQDPFTFDLPSVSQDILPTLIAMTGIGTGTEAPLDGINLEPLIQDRMEKRPAPIGFWHYPKPGIRTPSAELMSELLSSQTAGNTTGDTGALRLNAWQTASGFAESDQTGHAAWLDWPWKLHRIEDEDGAVRLELYNLEVDSMETDNMVEDETARATRMLGELANWQRSVMRSQNGADYALQQ